MTRQEQLDLVRAACIEANPSDPTLRDQNSGQGLQIKRAHGRPVRLADVLLAIERSDHDELYSVGEGGWFYQDTLQGDGYANMDVLWNLRKDDLTEQSDECVSFLAQLLG